MGLQNQIESLFKTYTNLPEDVCLYAAKQAAVIYGRSSAAKYGVKASAKKDGVYLGETLTSRCDGTPVMRLFASCSQLEQICSKLTNVKGYYLQRDIEARINVSPAFITTLQREMDGTKVADTKDAVECPDE